MEVITKAKISCPECGFEEDLEMPVDACQFFHECARCRTMLRPKAGDCCVFCSYGDVHCPSVQQRIEKE